MSTRLDDLYLEAEALVRNNSYLEAKQLYEQMLLDEPTSHQAHNSLGWIYKTQLEDYDKAEKHYRAAVKYAPAYPHPYINLAILLTDMERWLEAELLLDSAMQVALIDKCSVHIRYAFMYELRQDFEKAIEHFKLAAKFALNDERFENIRKDMERCKVKLEL